VPPDVACWRRVTLEIAPLAEITHTARDLVCANDIIFLPTSCMSTSIWPTMCYLEMYLILVLFFQANP
jgi:hypothetical protein